MTQRGEADHTSVVAVRFGELRTRRSEVFRHFSELGEADGAIVLAYYFWVIRAGERTILVDTGFNPTVGARRGRATLVAPADAFRMLGIEQSDPIDVVLTHAHYDHIGNVAWFEGARLIIAGAELRFWSSEEPQSRGLRDLAEEAEIEHLAALHAQGRLVLIDQTTEIAPGVTLIPAPGHTPGQIMVLVAGTTPILLTSDAVHFDEELDRGMPFRHMSDLAAADETYTMIRSMRESGALIITGHDDSVARRFPALPGPLSAHGVTISPDLAPPHVRSIQEEESP